MTPGFAAATRPERWFTRGLDDGGLRRGYSTREGFSAGVSPVRRLSWLDLRRG